MRPIPTITELYNNIKNDFTTRLNLIQAATLKFVLNASSLVIGAQLWLLYRYLGDVQNNIFPDTADSESEGGTLERIGRIKIGRNPFPASSGVFELEVIGVAGSVLRQALTFKSNDDSLNPGQLYVLDSEYTLIGSNDIIEVRSLGGGSSFNLDIGDNLTITEPVIGVNQTVTVSSIITQPANAEGLEDYRQAVLDSYQLEPQGGAKTDYRLWSSDAQGVRKIYPYVSNGNAGVVDVYVEANIADSTDGYGTPSASILENVLEVIEFDPDESKPLNERGRRPIQAIVDENSVQAVSIVPVYITITGLNQSTVAIQNAIQANIKAFLYDVRPYIAGADLLRNKNDILYQARLQAAVTDVLDSGNFFTGFDMQVNGISVVSYTFDLGNIPYLNSITYN